MVAIDTLSGVAVAKSTGRTAIYHKIRDVIDTHTEVPAVLISAHHHIMFYRLLLLRYITSLSLMATNSVNLLT